MNGKEELKFQMPAQGSSQFLTARKEMLDSFDKARTQSRKHKVETYHGNVAEAEFRKWLGNFLPKKFAVTSGYIISAGISDSEDAPHFDVIIYEHLESPILWIENSPDTTQQGRSLAIPAEYVKAVIEVKSVFKNSTVKKGLKQLGELKKLWRDIDNPEARYKKYLPANFFCDLVFFELRKKNEFEKLALNSIVEGIELKGFGGGIILRGEGQKKQATGRINIVVSQTKLTSNIRRPECSLLSNYSDADSVRKEENLHFGAMLNWAETNFSRYAFDLVALLNGTYKAGYLSSFHGLSNT